MAKPFNYVSSKSVVTKILRDSGLSDINRGDIIEWTGEVLQAIGTVGVREEHVMFITVKDHIADLPAEVEHIRKVYKYNSTENKDCIVPLDVVIDKDENGEPVLVDIKDPCGCIQDDDLPKYSGNFERRWAHLDWSNYIAKESTFVPIRLTSDILFSGITCEDINEGIGNCSYEYQLVQGGIRTSFRNGQIAIAYLTTPVDEDGYPLIPDLYSVQQAITYYVLSKVFTRFWYQGREGYAQQAQHAEQNFQFYIRQAKEDTWKLYGIDEHQNFINQRKKPFGNPGFNNLGRPSNVKPKGRR